MNKAAPWLAGSGFAIGHTLATARCTVLLNGRCLTCGGCVVALVSLTGWAFFKKKPANAAKPCRQPR